MLIKNHVDQVPADGVFVAAMAFTAAFAQSGSETLEPIDEIGGKNVGRLNCTVEGGWGLLIGSSKATTCAFDRTGG